MKIDRTNYEMWLIDYLDGNLSNDQLLVLRKFLEENPDIDQELNSFEEVRTTPDNKKYPNRNLLKKSPSEITEEQFNHLCVAWLEDDLSEKQSAELLEIAAVNTSYQRSFNLIKNLKLKPEIIRYPGKNKLIKKSPGLVSARQIIITGLSIAATVAILVIAFNNDEEKSPALNPGTIAETLIQEKSDSSERLNSVSLIPEAESKEISDEVTVYPAIAEETLVLPVVQVNVVANNEALKTENQVVEELPVPGPSYFSSLALSAPVNSELIAIDNMTIINPLPNAYHQGLKYYLTSLLRNTVLKDETPEPGPIRGYEIADAGIDGLNMLFGWEMKLEETKDIEGNLSSFEFNSRLLKFNTPVKKYIAQK